MADSAKVRVLLVVSMAALVAGCQGEGSPFGQRQAPGVTAPAAPGAAVEAAEAGTAEAAKPARATTKSVKLVDRDVEAPEVFSVSDMALWDGRPSLGGVWVASPDAIDPERVILRNAANGKFVIGALFRRERDNPGPPLQISSDAAAALGLLAGQPAKISVTALRREEAPIAAPDASRPILDAAETVATETLEPAAGAPAATAAAAPTEEKPRGFGLFKKRQPKADGPVAPIVSTNIAAPAATAQAPAPQGAAAPAPATPAPATAAPASGGLIQIGIFSVEANAKRAVDTLAKAGVAAAIREETSQGKTFWSVTARGGADSLGKVKAAGFGDAYMLKRG